MFFLKVIAPGDSREADQNRGESSGSADAFDWLIDLVCKSSPSSMHFHVTSLPGSRTKALVSAFQIAPVRSVAKSTCRNKVKLILSCPRWDLKREVTRLSCDKRFSAR